MNQNVNGLFLKFNLNISSVLPILLFYSDRLITGTPQGKMLQVLELWVFLSIVTGVSLRVCTGLEDGYNLFHIPKFQSTSSTTSRQNHQFFPWQQSPEKWRSKDLLKGGFGLKLFHRDDADSPLISISSSVHKRFIYQMHRDRVRVHLLDETLIKLTEDSKTAGSTSRPPLRTPVISGLDEGSGEYFTTISFGSPSTDVLVTMDTGSDLMWIQCQRCDNCYDQLGPIFDPSESKTYYPIDCYSQACDNLSHKRCEAAGCQYDISYGDGSFTKGDLARETLTMNNTKEKPFEINDFYFGCGHDNEGLFIASSGILGLGRGDLSFPSQLSKILAPKFSYCLTDRFSDFDTRNSFSSYLYFGGSDTSHMRFTPLIHNLAAPTFYYIQMRGISVGKKVLEIPNSAFEMDAFGRGGVILDSGTSVTRLSFMAYQALRDEFRATAKNLKRVEISGQDLFDTCFEITRNQEIPTITLHFADNVDLELPSDNVLIPVDTSGTLFCLAFAEASRRSSLSIIGNIQQQGFRIEFDLSSKFRVGFTRQDCSIR
ncbi:hypothetical protein R1sor_022044 [Riccia sorocarpa]|uniref:nepenthesin n=1 Tax=Riccia sorocarpa TaxID=122646 RepID=A0ABD3GJF3_9MARC